MTTVARALERMRNVPGLRGDVTSVVVLVIAALLCGGFIFSKYAFVSPLADRYVFAAEFEKAPGVRPASRQEVRIAGVTVGKITGADLLGNGNAKLTMSLEPGHTVYSNARVLLRTKAPLNIMYVALDPGGPPAEPLEPGAVLPVSQTARPIQPFEALEKLDERAQVALTAFLNQTDAALVGAKSSLPNGLNSTDAAMQSFKPVLEELATRRETIAKLVTSLAQISSAVGTDDKRLARLTDSLHTTLQLVANRDSELGAALDQVPGFSQDLRAAMRGVSGLSSELNPTLEALQASSRDLPGALRRLSKTMGEASTFVDSAGPFVAKARPVVADLRPFARDLNSALGDFAPTARLLPSATKRLVPWLEDLSAFVYQTSSAFSLADANGGWGRALLTFDVTNPAGGLKPMPGIGEGN